MGAAPSGHPAVLRTGQEVLVVGGEVGQSDVSAEGEGRAELQDSDVIGEAGAVAAVLGVLKSVDKMETLQYCDEQQ